MDTERVGDWIASWMPRETRSEPGDPWRPVILGYEDRPLSGQTYYPEDEMLGGGGSSRGDPQIVSAWGSDPSGFPETLEVEWTAGGQIMRQTYRPTGPSSAG